MLDKKICVVGLGYIGLPTAALIASKGFEVCGVDVNKTVVSTVNQGRIHIVEPKLERFVSTAVKSGKLFASTVPLAADIYIIAVPTPFHPTRSDGPDLVPTPNLEFVYAALRSISSLLKSGDLVVLESTSPVGTTESLVRYLDEMGVSSQGIYFAHSPERVIPGNIMFELVSNDRVVGGVCTLSTKKAVEFYRCFVEGEVLATDSKTAEMVKLTENSFRDVNIAFANEISMLCDRLEVDVRELISLANRHPRVDVLQPGCGVGGHCISVDPWFIVSAASGDAKLIEQARRTNILKANWVIQQVRRHVEKFTSAYHRPPSVGCLGVTYKADVDDVRESPALYIARGLTADCRVVVADPYVKYIDGIDLVSLDDALEMDIVVLLVKHQEYNNITHPELLSFVG